MGQLSSITRLEESTAIGFGSLRNNSTGQQNTAVGFNALSVNTIGSNNTAIGDSANVSSNNLTNATAIGHGAIVNASNKVRIGNGSVMTIEGNVAFSPSSDKRLKEDIKTTNLGLDFITDLRPVQYHRINNPENKLELGLIAQELEATLKKFGADQIGIIGQSSDGMMTLRYNDLFAPLIKALQELKEENIELEKTMIFSRASLPRWKRNY
ncbi:MAG: tail fiber domain-containing protein [Saprospiraceae bacterium]|nr:tail fiber domain-containing protein [Saprospiraceae bacterium]